MKKNLVSKANKDEALQSTKRKQARYIVYTELIFVLLPFVLLGLEKLSFSIVFNPEWSLAASLLFGQAAARLFSGIAKHRIPNGVTVVLYGMFCVGLSIVSVYNYSKIQNSLNQLSIYIIIQFVLFFYSLIAFIVFGAIGQRLMDMPES